MEVHHLHNDCRDCMRDTDTSHHTKGLWVKDLEMHGWKYIKCGSVKAIFVRESIYCNLQYVILSGMAVFWELTALPCEYFWHHLGINCRKPRTWNKDFLTGYVYSGMADNHCLFKVCSSSISWKWYSKMLPKKTFLPPWASQCQVLGLAQRMCRCPLCVCMCVWETVIERVVCV